LIKQIFKKNHSTGNSFIATGHEFDWREHAISKGNLPLLLTLESDGTR
jgi:hypothetical protein